MDNNQIADLFTMLSKLSDIHGENPFKGRSYAATAFAIEKLPVPISELPIEKLEKIKGIGEITAKKIREIVETGKLSKLEKLISLTPPGVIEMLHIKGIGPKKIRTIWKDMEIESIGELLYACKENRLKLYKGFGEKTQQNVIQSIEFYLNNKGHHLYARVELAEPHIHSMLHQIFNNSRIAVTGEFLRQSEIINELEYVIDKPIEAIKKKMEGANGFTEKESGSDWCRYGFDAGILIKLFGVGKDGFEKQLIITSCSAVFYNGLASLPHFSTVSYSSDASFFSSLKLPVVPFPMRETLAGLNRIIKKGTPVLIQPEDIHGIIHSHSNWSDGNATIEEMAVGARELGMEYLVISDHSKSAFYANGLSEERIMQQHEYINQLNKKLSPFRIFKSIESDILYDGNLDYDNNILALFDLVIASVHSNLKMTKEKAMQRLMGAIQNPYTTILGHMTGRLLLSREGYPVDHNKIIDECIKQDVVIELNANPNRLDMDWRYIDTLLDQGGMISINPDAHSIDGLEDTRYGVFVAQKAGVTSANNLSSMPLKEFEAFISRRKKQKAISLQQ